MLCAFNAADHICPTLIQFVFLIDMINCWQLVAILLVSPQSCQPAVNMATNDKLKPDCDIWYVLLSLQNTTQPATPGQISTSLLNLANHLIR
jgi:hypothetical protein